MRDMRDTPEEKAERRAIKAKWTELKRQRVRTAELLADLRRHAGYEYMPAGVTKTERETRELEAREYRLNNSRYEEERAEFRKREEEHVRCEREFEAIVECME